MARLTRYAPHLVLAAGAFVMLLPFYWMLLTSIRSPAEIFDVSLWPIPKVFDAAENYSRAAASNTFGIGQSETSKISAGERIEVSSIQ